MTDVNSEVADKNDYGDVTAKNQDGQTEQEILNDATSEQEIEAPQNSDITTYDIQFKCSTTVDAHTHDEAYVLACRYWDEHQKRTTDELNITIRPL